jgi:hypothetical protein
MRKQIERGRPMRKSGVTSAMAAIAIVLSWSGNAFGEAIGPADPSADKGRYSFLQPVPSDQLRSMDTDRPNKTNTPHTIDAGHAQVELGFADYIHNHDRSHGADTVTDSLALGHVNLRLGMLNNLEVNLATDSYDLVHSKDRLANTSTRQSGIGDTVVGGKLNLWGNEGGDAVWATGLAIQPQLKIPTAQRDLGNKHTELFVGVPFVINLPAEFHLGLQTLVAWERNLANTGDVTGWQNSASLDRVFFDAVDVYVEYWSHVSTERHQQPQQTVDVGLIYPLTDNITLDLGTVIGVNRASNAIEALAGMSIRF